MKPLSKPSSSPHLRVNTFIAARLRLASFHRGGLGFKVTTLDPTHRVKLLRFRVWEVFVYILVVRGIATPLVEHS